ncbi:hypothetical protein NW766_012724 [Fusarium irregulare]|uniref:Transcription factor domain-containing protein n=1 Tax=Fusarium irregulare TaxID=2494466 RepID=A0A9W8PD49_9HYPO|nr:hypothetical protein NW766_012724 [Fusarium irregulare]
MLREMPRSRETSATSEAHNASPSPQPQNLIRSLLPFNPLEQELMVRNPIAYPILLPMAVSDLPLKELTSRRPGMTATQVLRDTASPSSADMMLTDDEESNEDALFEFCQGLPHLCPSHVEYLRKADLTLYMELPIPNETAVRVIALYLNNDYPVLPLFHADLFLRDLCQNQPYFCSALLISALLGWALSALHFMCMTAITHGQDDLGLDYLRQGLELGQKMGILNAEPGTQAGWLTGYADWTRAVSYAAWGAYNLASVDVEIAPGLPMPGDIDGDLAIQEDKLHISYVNGQAFNASCKLWIIFAPVAKRYYQGSNMSVQHASVEFAEEIYRQLLAWADELPLELVRRPGSCHGVHMLHANNATPQTVYQASIEQMKRLLLSHRSDMGPEVLSIFWQSCVIYVANAVIHSGDDQNERQFYVNLCLIGLQELYLSYRISGTMVKAIVVMAIRNGALENYQAVDIRRRLGETATRFEMDTWVVRSWVIIDLNLAVSDSAGAQGGKIAEDFDSSSGAKGDD